MSEMRMKRAVIAKRDRNRRELASLKSYLTNFYISRHGSEAILTSCVGIYIDTQSRTRNWNPTFCNVICDGQVDRNLHRAHPPPGLG